MFPYVRDELDSKPQLDLIPGALKKQNNLGIPLTSMQTFYLFIILPFILNILLHSSNFSKYHAILISVNIFSIHFSVTIAENTHKQLAYLIKPHNDLLRKLCPSKMKFKFHFMTHFPDFMKDLGSLVYTLSLAIEKKNISVFCKGNKIRNMYR